MLSGSVYIRKMAALSSGSISVSVTSIGWVRGRLIDYDALLDMTGMRGEALSAKSALGVQILLDVESVSSVESILDVESVSDVKSLLGGEFV